ncbi:MAG: hypothetical protein H3C30_08225 [Candidatus Hydrogenedentes bacterium]|nr:hypothetical protein [Candidatus Hydrogenedentota bacterium]
MFTQTCLLLVAVAFSSTESISNNIYLAAWDIVVPYDTAKHQHLFSNQMIYKLSAKDEMINKVGIQSLSTNESFVSMSSCKKFLDYILVECVKSDRNTNETEYLFSIYGKNEQFIKCIPNACASHIDKNHVIYYNTLKNSFFTLNDNLEEAELDCAPEGMLVSFGIADGIISLFSSSEGIIDYDYRNKTRLKDNLRDAGTCASIGRKYYLNASGLYYQDEFPSLTFVLTENKVVSYINNSGVNYIKLPFWICGTILNCIVYNKYDKEYQAWLYDASTGNSWCLKGDVWVLSVDNVRQTITTLAIPNIDMQPAITGPENSIPVTIKEEPLVKYAVNESIFMTPTYTSDGVISFADTDGNLFLSVPKEKQISQKYKWYRNEKPLETDLVECIGSNTPYLWVSLEWEKLLNRDVKRFLGSYTCRCYDEEGNVYTHGPITVVE